MRTSVAMTSKGQFTLPANVRRALHLNAKGDTLQLEFDPHTNTLRLMKPVTFKELQQFVQAKSKHPNEPLPPNVHEWYTQERIKQLRGREVI
jgi:bifunctional DNA-binding transcriptional regulator/antitoxin component of YhaV-PrlF toxin-antitoxin module